MQHASDQYILIWLCWLYQTLLFLSHEGFNSHQDSFFFSSLWNCSTWLWSLRSSRFRLHRPPLAHINACSAPLTSEGWRIRHRGQPNIHLQVLLALYIERLSCFQVLDLDLALIFLPCFIVGYLHIHYFFLHPFFYNNWS